MSYQYLTMGVLGKPFKENEHRLPIHPDHLANIDEALKKHIYLEKDYGERFGLKNEDAVQHCAGELEREALFEKCDIILLPKPVEEDFEYFREGQIHWGWSHLVQGEPITQVGIDKKMTMITWESMHVWEPNGSVMLHTFHKNNEIAGYSSVLHALQLAGRTGHYGPILKAAVISFGSAGRGAITALRGMGIHDVTVYTNRPYQILQNQFTAMPYRQFSRNDQGDAVVELDDGNTVPMAQELMGYDLIVNCILQDTDKPFMFIKNSDLAQLKAKAMIVDVSCDLGMGFEFARPTTFEEPVFEVGDGILYYGVDHTPSFMWNSATFEISTALMPHLATVMAGPEGWEADQTIRNAIEIRDGLICNEKILNFQGRSPEYPHFIRT